MFRTARTPTANRVSIDLGGYHSRIFHHADGLILDEPSLGLLDMDNRHSGAKAVAFYGRDAETHAPKQPGGRLIQPLQADCQNNVGYSTRMLRYFFSKLRRSGDLGKAPVVMLTVPPGIPKALSDDLRHACFTGGASRVHMLENPIALAMGAGVAINEPQPKLLLDIGARAARLYAFQHNEVIAAHTIPFGGDSLDEALATSIRKRYGLYVSSTQARQAKHRIGSAIPSHLDQEFGSSVQMTGLYIHNSTKTNFTLTSDAACEMLQPALQAAAKVLQEAIGSLPYQYRDAQRDVSITITGGGSQLHTIDQLVMEAADRPVEIVKRPLSATVRGGAEMLKEIHGEEVPTVSA